MTAAQKKKKTAKKITETYLHNAGLYYLQRFAASTEQFRTVMNRKIMRSCAAHADQDIAECKAMLEALIEKFRGAGLLDDDTYARQTVTKLRRRGASSSAIAHALQKKGIGAPAARTALDQYDETTGTENSDLLAALRLARRKRLGAFSTGTKKTDVEKSLAAYARAGFSYETARRALSMDADEALKIIEDSGAL